MRVIEEKDNKEKRKRIVTIIVIAFFIVDLIVGAILLILWLNNKEKEQTPDNTPPQEEEVFDNTESIKIYDRLLKILNDEATANHEIEATELVSIDYDDSYHFYIIGKNDTKIYDYSIDMSSEGVTIEESLDYLLDKDPSSTMTKIFDSYNIQDIPEGFTTKYSGDTLKYKAVSMEIGSKRYITSTMYDSSSKKVYVIHKEDIDTVLSTNYSPKEIEIDIGSYPLYRYIATR